MQLTLTLDIPRLPQPLTYRDQLLLTGSCFTEHIAGRLAQHKFSVLQNPHGILFNPLSVAGSLDSYLEGRQYAAADLFFLNETWNSWDHHTRFSDVDPEKALQKINTSQEEAGRFIREAKWVVITLGSAFQYYLKDGEKPVANNHRAPAQWFEKRLLEIDGIVGALSNTIAKLLQANPSAQVLFTISPVRHIRDGVVANNRSKARLIEAVHTLCDTFPQCHYFPAYELVIDILRDYRFYDIDFVHPNYLATETVWEHFAAACIAPEALPVMEQVKDIMVASSHRPRFPGTEGHRKFMAAYAEKVRRLKAAHPYLDLTAEAAYFTGNIS